MIPTLQAVIRCWNGCGQRKAEKNSHKPSPTLTIRGPTLGT
jgi:hypothetical protein